MSAKRQRRRVRAARDWEWHERQMADGPGGYRELTWDQWHAVFAEDMRQFSRLPASSQFQLKYPNPEDQPKRGR